MQGVQGVWGNLIVCWTCRCWREVLWTGRRWSLRRPARASARSNWRRTSGRTEVRATVVLSDVE